MKKSYIRNQIKIFLSSLFCKSEKDKEKKYPQSKLFPQIEKDSNHKYFNMAKELEVDNEKSGL